MSTGLTFGTISALYGLTHQLITQEQYSHLVAAVIGSAVIPTIIANAFFLPYYLLPKSRAHEGDEQPHGVPAVPEAAATGRGMTTG
jgi:hypothetical protein